MFLNETNIPSILVDARKLPRNYGLADLYRVISESMSNPGFLEKTKNILESIKSVKIVGFEVELSWSGRESLTLGTLFDYLNKKQLIIAVDEAQYLRGPRGRVFLDALAHAYDYDRNLTFILTGSEVGFLYDYLGIDNPDSPLYGRYAKTIILDRFNPSQSLEFLIEGFKEAGLTLPRAYLEELVSTFDGIPGWLTLAGNYVLSRKGPVPISELEEYAVKTAVKELSKLKEVHGPRIIRILKLIAEGYNSWGTLKTGLERIEKRIVSKSSLSRMINTLTKLSIIQDYRFLDPIYEKASKQIEH